MKKTLLAVALAAATTTAYADVKLSGHVNYAAGDTDDLGPKEDFTVDDATISQSRFRIVASQDVNGITYGLREEFGLNDNSLSIRHNEFYVKGGFGKVTVGQGPEAGDGNAEMDYSGTYLGNSGGLGTWNLGTNSDGSDLSFSQPEPSRTERVRYDSPKLGGLVTIAIDQQDDDDNTVGVRASGSNIKAAVYYEKRDVDDSDEVGGSIAGHFGGFTASFAMVDRDETASGANDNFEYQRFIVGYKSGPYSVAVDFQTNENDAGLDKESTGLTGVYRPAKGIELYAAWREIDNKAENADGSGALVGGRVKF